MDSKLLVIIGAGASGIAAATKALELGFSNVMLLEAENRIGGRIYNTSLATNNIDLGAFWCDSGKEHFFFEKICEDHRKLFQNTSQNLHCIRSNKDILPPDICKKLQQIIVELSDKGRDVLKLPNDSLRTYLIKNFNKWLEEPENTKINKNLAYEFLEYYQKFENSIRFADNFFGGSHRFLLNPYTYQYDTLQNKESYYTSYLNYLMKSTKDNKYGILQEKIFLNKKVKQIKWSLNTGVKTLITCTDGYQLEADHVFCTVSLGVLKENYLSLFQPSFSIPKIKAIKELSFQTVNKVFLDFSIPFWSNNWLGFTMLWSESDLKDIQKRSDNWIEDIFGFFTDYQQNSLCAWILGESGRKMELFSDDEVINSCVFLLKKFLNTDIPIPVNIKRSTWNTNLNFRGSYSFRSMQAETINTSPFYLSTPILNENGIPIIQFCGDSTHFEYYGTVRGAIESGWREAKQLANIYYNEKKVDSNIYDVLILGAGLAGLGAAYALRKSNMKVKILEAQDYIGGRVLTTPLHSFLPNKTNPLDLNLSSIDTGAQWLHGEQNELYKIAQKYNLIKSEHSEEGLGLYIRDDGYKFENSFKNKIDAFVEIILEKCRSFINSDEYPISVGNYLRTKFENFLKGFENFDERNKALQLLDWHIRFQMIDNSCLSLEDLSARDWGQYALDNESCQAHINLKNGFSSLIDAIIAEIGGTKNILLQHEINEINWNNPESPNKMIKVNIVNNKIFFAKHVIVTFSLGILKNTESKLFKPNLPEKYRSAIKSIGFDTINKIFLQFDTRWWGNLKGIQLVYGDDKSIVGHKKWTRFISGFDILTPGPKNTLIGWVGGYGAVEMEQLSDEDIIEDCLDVLRKFTKLVIPDPIKYYCTRWGTNKFVRGGYSYTSIQCDKNNVDKKIFSEPISCIKLPFDNCLKELIERQPQKKLYPPPTLSFAGEAYHSSYFSTAHGAFLSGMEQVELFLNNESRTQ